MVSRVKDERMMDASVFVFTLMRIFLRSGDDWEKSEISARILFSMGCGRAGRWRENTWEGDGTRFIDFCAQKKKQKV